MAALDRRKQYSQTDEAMSPQQDMAKNTPLTRLEVESVHARADNHHHSLCSDALTPTGKA